MEKNNFQTELLHFISFNQLDKWYVSYYINPYKIQSQFELVSLDEILSPLKQKISKQNYKKNFDIVAKISFSDGKIHLRPERETGMDLYFVPKNALLVSKINFHQGALAINEISDLVCSTHYQPYEVINENIYLPYLVLVLRAKKFQDFLSYLRADGIKNEATFDFIKQLQIPLPDVNTQKALVQAYQEKMAKADELGKQANQIDNDIEHYLFEQLGIEIQQTPKAQIGKLRFVNFRDLNLWGVTSQNAITAETIFKSNQFKNEPITTFFEINPTTQIPKNQIISFIPMANISDIYGEISVHDKKTLKPNYTKFKENDLIWAKITPCMENGKSAVATNLENGFGFGSTEFHVLRARNNDFSIYLLHLLLRTKHLRKIATQYFTGSSGQQRVPKTFLETLTLPVLSLETQTQITNYIQAQKQRQKSYLATAAALRLGALTEFEQAIFSNKSNCFFVN